MLTHPSEVNVVIDHLFGVFQRHISIFMAFQLTFPHVPPRSFGGVSSPLAAAADDDDGCYGYHGNPDHVVKGCTTSRGGVVLLVGQFQLLCCCTHLAGWWCNFTFEITQPNRKR